MMDIWKYYINICVWEKSSFFCAVTYYMDCHIFLFTKSTINIEKVNILEKHPLVIKNSRLGTNRNALIHITTEPKHALGLNIHHDWTKRLWLHKTRTVLYNFPLKYDLKVNYLLQMHQNISTILCQIIFHVLQRIILTGYYMATPKIWERTPVEYASE